MSNSLPYSIDYIEKLKLKIIECIEIKNGDTSPSERIEAEKELEKNIIYFFMIIEKNQNYIGRKLETIKNTADSLKFNI